MTKKILILLVLILLALICMAGCAGIDWVLVDEGVLTDIGTIYGRVALTLDGGRILLLKSGYSVEFPDVLVLGDYYYIYKEDASACWNGYHIVKEER